jgi:thioredoxin-dependent peroxiredoxin
MAKELKEGDKAPAFRLVSSEGKTYRLAALKGKTLVLYFYPKAMTTGCTLEACDFRDLTAHLTQKGAVVLGVSRDSPERLAKFRAKHDLSFPLLSDEAGTVCEAYGVWKEKSLYGRKFMGIERTTFVIGPDGRIKKIFAKVKVKGHAAAVLESL